MEVNNEVLVTSEAGGVRPSCRPDGNTLNFLKNSTDGEFLDVISLLFAPTVYCDTFIADCCRFESIKRYLHININISSTMLSDCVRLIVVNLTPAVVATCNAAGAVTSAFL